MLKPGNKCIFKHHETDPWIMDKPCYYVGSLAGQHYVTTEWNPGKQMRMFPVMLVMEKLEFDSLLSFEGKMYRLIDGAWCHGQEQLPYEATEKGTVMPFLAHDAGPSYMGKVKVNEVVYVLACDKFMVVNGFNVRDRQVVALSCVSLNDINAQKPDHIWVEEWYKRIVYGKPCFRNGTYTVFDGSYDESLHLIRCVAAT